MARRTAPRPLTAPRKQPRHERAQVTRDAMIVAAERVLAKYGVAGFTTNHVADVAGVSIGSVYQYFPNKQSILATLIERNASQFEETFARVLAAHPSHPPEAVALTLGLEFRAVYQRQGKVHLELYDQAPALGLRLVLEGSLAQMTHQLARWLGSNPCLAVRDPQATAWVFVRAVEGIARSFAIAQDDVPEEAVMMQTIAMLLAALPRRSEQIPG